MDNILFYKQFGFVTYSFKTDKHTDNSAGTVCHFIGKVVHGSATFKSLDGQVMLVDEGDVFYIPLGLKYHSYWQTDKQGRLEWQSYRFSVFPQKENKRYLLQKLFTDTSAREYLSRIDRDQEVDVGSVGALYSFLGRVLPDMKEAYKDPREMVFERVKEYIAKNPSFYVSDLAKYCSMSESGIYAFFREYAKTTPVHLKNSIWAEKGIELLRSTDLPIEEICNRCGFQSVAYFRKVLADRTGKIPSQIRKEQNIL